MAVRRAPLRLSAIAIAIAIVGLARGEAQSSFDRASSTQLPPPQYVVIDDQVFDVAGHTLSAAEGRFRPQGATLDNDSVTWVFDICPSERLSGASPSVAWPRVVTAIQSTQAKQASLMNCQPALHR